MSSGGQFFMSPDIEPFQPNVWPGGCAVAVSVSPNNSSIAIVGSESGGLFQTRDGGNTWRHLDGLLPFRMADFNTARRIRNAGLPLRSPIAVQATPREFG